MPQPTHAELLAARWAQGDPSLNPQLAQQLAAQEHRAFSREWSQESPFAAAVSLPFAIPGYAAAKYGAQKLGLPIQYLQGTPPSFHQMGEAYRGLGEGLGARVRGLLQ